MVCDHFGAVCSLPSSKEGLSSVLFPSSPLFHLFSQACTCVSFAPAKTANNEKGHPPETLSSLLAAGYRDGSLRVFNITKTQVERKMQPHASPVTKVAFSMDGMPVCVCASVQLLGVITSIIVFILFSSHCAIMSSHFLCSSSRVCPLLWLC